MSEEEEFREMEMRQVEQSLIKLAGEAADKFVIQHRDSLDILTLHQAYKRGYKDALIDVIIKGKEML